MPRRFLPWFLVAAVAVLVMFLLLRFVVYGRFAEPDYRAQAEEGRPILAAIYAFRNEHGLWPQRLEDLVPAFLSAAPGFEWRYFGHRRGFSLNRLTGWQRSTVEYHVAPDHQAPLWELHDGDNAGFLKIEVPPFEPPPSTLAEPEKTARRVAELERRIAREPRQLIHYQELAGVLVGAERPSDARQVVARCGQALPQHWWPVVAAAFLDRKLGDAQADARLEAWVKSSPGFSRYWYLARFRRDSGDHEGARAALALAAALPLQNEPDAGYVADFFGYDAARYAYRQGKWELCLTLCDSMDALKARQGYAEPSYLILRAAALLALGRVDEAGSAAAMAAAEAGTRATWADNKTELLRRIESGDMSYRWEPGRTSENFEVFPKLE